MAATKSCEPSTFDRIQNTEYFIDNRNQYRSLVTRANKDYTRTRSTSKQT